MTADKSSIFKRSEENMTFLLEVKRFAHCFLSWKNQSFLIGENGGTLVNANLGIHAGITLHELGKIVWNLAIGTKHFVVSM